jgi:L-asparaginase II
MIHSSEKVVEVQRAGLKESAHNGFIVVVDDTGRVLHAIGNPQEIVFARSAAKPLQAIAILDNGADEKYTLRAEEIALMCASHNGEQLHVNAVNKMLNKLELNDSDLSCGIHMPFHRASTEEMTRNQVQATTLHNNCSGKHAGMLALAKTLGVPTLHYAQPEHPVQLAMRKVVAEMAGLSAEQLQLGIDGCGVPVFALPLANLATAYARLGTGHACSDIRKKSTATIIAAISQHPEYIAGDDRYDTLLIRTTSGRIIGKMGAEGVFALCIPSQKIGIGIKIEDGNFRALYPTVTETLRQLGYLSDEEHAALLEWHPSVFRNHAGTEVGLIQPCFQLLN